MQASQHAQRRSTEPARRPTLPKPRSALACLVPLPAACRDSSTAPAACLTALHPLAWLASPLAHARAHAHSGLCTRRILHTPYENVLSPLRAPAARHRGLSPAAPCLPICLPRSHWWICCGEKPIYTLYYEYVLVRCIAESTCACRPRPVTGQRLACDIRQSKRGHGGAGARHAIQ